MSQPYSPRQILCINLSATQLPILLDKGHNKSQNLMHWVMKSSMQEIQSAMKIAAFDALIVGTSHKDLALWQDLQDFHTQSPYFPVLLLSEKSTTPEIAREMNFPFLCMDIEPSYDHLILQISQAILQAKMQLHDQQQLDQWAMLDQMEKLPFTSEEELIKDSLEQCRKLTQSEFAFALHLNFDHQITDWISTTENELIASLKQDSILQERIQTTLNQKKPTLYSPLGTPLPEGPVYRCMLHPVLEEEESHHLLVLINKSTPYHDQDILFIKQATNKIWGQIRSRKNEALLHQRLQELETLNRIFGRLRQANSKEEFLDSLLVETLDILNSDVGAILIYDKQTKRMSSAAARGWIKNIHDIQVHVDYGISGRVFRSGKPLITDEFKSHPDLHPSARDRFMEGWGGACYPITSAEKVIGVLFLCVALPRILSQYEIWLLSTLVEFAGNSLQRLEVSSDLEKTKSNLAWEDEQLIQLLETLSKDRELLRVTLMEIGEGVITLNQMDEITLINHQAEIITGFAEREVLGQHIEAILCLIDPKTNQPIDNVLRHLIGIDEMEKNGQIQPPPMLLNKFNRKILITGNISPINNSEGVRIGTVLVMKDITERSELESQMTLLKKMEAIGQLATGIAHEINTPIQYINENLMYIQRGFTQINHLIQQGEKYLNLVPLDRKGKFLLPDELASLNEINQLLENRNTRHYLNEIPTAIHESLEGIEKVRKIILAIREFSHPSDHEKKPSAINHAIQNMLIISKNEWKNVAEVELDLEPDLPLVTCRVDEINQALLNMVINAAQAIESHPLRLPNQLGKIIIKTWHSTVHVFISIQDTGCGIDQLTRDRIFDPFFTTKEIGHGTGQGLFIAHTIIVKKHQGLISVESEKNQGTLFTIQLPISEDQTNK